MKVIYIHTERASLNCAYAAKKKEMKQDIFKK